MFASKSSVLLIARVGCKIRHVHGTRALCRLLTTDHRTREHFLNHGLRSSAGLLRAPNWRLSHGSGQITPFILPDIGEGIKEVVIKSWLIKIGDKIKQFDPICDVESDKATATISSRFEGTVTAIHYSEGDMAQVGKPLIDIQAAGAKVADPNPEPKRDSTARKPNLPSTESFEKVPEISSEPSVLALPSARRAAKEAGLDLRQVVASGRKGQVLKEDVIRHLQSSKASPLDQKQPEALASRQILNREQTVPLSSVGKAMFKTMTQSVQVPHFSYADDIDMTRIFESSKARAEFRRDVKVSNFAIFIKMVSKALIVFPQLNASPDPSGQFLIQKNYHNIGIAVDTEAGLIVPNIKNVQDLSIERVNTELIRLKKLAYDSKLGLDDLSGGTMTLSNIGAIGGLFGVPVLLRPEILIGALGKARKVPYLNSSGGLSERSMMQIVWSADHRVVDGATLSRFTNLLKTYLQEPEVAFLNMV